MVSKTRDDFIELLKTSELFDSEQLAELCRITEGLTGPASVARKLVELGFISRWQASEFLGGRPPRRIGNYQLLDLLEEESAGPVFLANDVSLNCKVVLKALARLDKSDVPIELLLADAQRLVALNHRNLCRVLGVESDGDTHYLVMERIVGRTLRQIIEAEGSFSERRAIDLIATVAGVLARTHSQGIRHLGLDPDQLIIDIQGTLKLRNVGVEQLNALTRPVEAVPRTPQSLFLAPEQLRAGQLVDQRADIYALGCVCYYVLAGNLPESADSRAADAETTSESLLDIQSQRPDVSDELADVCRRMTALQPDERFGSVQEVIRVLESWSRPAPSSGPRVMPEEDEAVVPLPRPERNLRFAMRKQGSRIPATTKRPRRERKRLGAAGKRPKLSVEKIAVLGAAVVLALLAIAILSSFSSSTPETAAARNRPPAAGPRQPMRRERVAASDEPTFSAGRPCRVNLPNQRPESRRVTLNDSRQRRQLWTPGRKRNHQTGRKSAKRSRPSRLKFCRSAGRPRPRSRFRK